jgi:quercetin dioxygenase-like cupin family protein
MNRTNEGEREYPRGEAGRKFLFNGPFMEGGLVRLLPGEKAGAHRHCESEELFFVLDGSPLVLTPGAEHRAEEGDALRFEPGEMHDLVNDTDAPVRVLFVKSPYRPDDREDADQV